MNDRLCVMLALSTHTGSWTGTNGFRLMPDDPPHDAIATATVSIAAAGNLTTIAYTWSHPEDGVQEGLLTIGADEETGTVLALWGDSWHQSPAAKILVGAIDGAVATVGYDYADGWRWQITIDAARDDVLTLRMDNIVPAAATGESGAAEAYPAMSTVLRHTA